MRARSAATEYVQTNLRHEGHQYAHGLDHEEDVHKRHSDNGEGECPRSSKRHPGRDELSLVHNVHLI